MANGSRFEVDDPRFRPGETGAEIQLDEPEAPVQRRSWVAGCLMGCLMVFVILLVIAGIGLFWLFQNWREVASSAGSAVLKQSIEATELPEQEKAEIGVQVDRLAAAFREGRINEHQLGAIVERVVESPLMTTIAVSAIERKYVTGSGLTDQEKAEGRQTLRRFLRGAIDDNIDEQAMDAAMQHVADRDDEGNWRLRERVSDEDLREFFKAAKQAADEAQVEAEPEDVDPSDEFKRIIDEAMQGGGAVFPREPDR